MLSNFIGSTTNSGTKLNIVWLTETVVINDGGQESKKEICNVVAEKAD